MVVSHIKETFLRLKYSKKGKNAGKYMSKVNKLYCSAALTLHHENDILH